MNIHLNIKKLTVNDNFLNCIEHQTKLTDLCITLLITLRIKSKDYISDVYTLNFEDQNQATMHNIFHSLRNKPPRTMQKGRKSICLYFNLNL